MTREEAIIDLNALKFILDNDQYTDEIEEALDIAIEALQQPEPPEPKKGRWIVKRDIKTGVAYGECSSCGMKNYAGHTNFCPNCGTKMKEGDTEC